MNITLKKSALFNSKAFTLLELMLSIFIFAIIGGVIAGAYMSGTRISDDQEKMNELQQNLRVALYIMSREIRMAGTDIPKKWDNDIVDLENRATDPSGTQTSLQLRYTVTGAYDMDWDGTSDDGQEVTVVYSIVRDPTLPPERNLWQLQRSVTINNVTTVFPLVDNICAVRFSFFNGSTDKFFNRTWSTTSGTGGTNPVAVGISAVAECSTPDKKIPPASQTFTEPFTNTTVYTSPVDRLRRRMATAVVNLRNVTNQMQN
jgi:type IV pilus assembly protein PilW